MDKVKDQMSYRTKWTVKKYADEQAVLEDSPYYVSSFDGNLLLNEGIAEALDIVAGLGAPTTFNNTNANIGVGDSATAEAATQTGLQAATNKLYKAMQATYPSRSAQTLTFRSQFGSSEANFAWNEFTIANGTSDSAKNLNRKVSAQGTKTSGQTWTVDCTVTLS